jgi:hypothetical protein
MSLVNRLENNRTERGNGRIEHTNRTHEPSRTIEEKHKMLKRILRSILEPIAREYEEKEQAEWEAKQLAKWVVEQAKKVEEKK